MVVSGIVETRRKSMACQHDVVDSLQPLPMSVFWLGYEYAILSYELKLERFLTTHKDLDVGRGEYFELIPFDFGRKGYFGLQMVHLTLASFLQAFDISTSSNACTTITRFEQEPDESGRKFNQRCNRCHLEKNVRKDHSRLRTLYRSRGCYKLLKRNQPRKHHSVSISPKQDMMEQCS
ncbi:hypothetical protein Gorai_012348, partial [Gossypium raimondii]|nr:hypothetical protein [Gossypium raimondii]